MFGWSWKLGRIAGIDVYIHMTFFLLVGWIFVSSIVQGDSVTGALFGVIFTLAIFCCIVLHELGHALAARRYGIATRDITLLPIGGVAHLARMPEKPSQELVVAIAGPMVNIVIIAALLGWMSLYGAVVSSIGMSIHPVHVITGGFVTQLIAVNIYLVVFNLIPAFPMDGGRVVRALLALKLPYHRATSIAAKIGQGLAFVFGFIGLFGYPMLLIIAFFVFFGAQQENTFVQARSALDGVPVSYAMITDFYVLSPDDSIARAVERILAGFQEDFPVVEIDRLVGMLFRSDLLAALAANSPASSVRSIMQQSFESVASTETLATVFIKLQTSASKTIPVLHGQSLVGIVTAHNLSEFLMIRAALHR